MQRMNQARMRSTAVVLLALGPMLASCAADWATYPAPAYSEGRERRSPNGVAAQTGRLTVVALDFFDGRPLNKAEIDIVASSSGEEVYHYRRTGYSNQFGIVTFTDVPRSVNVFIRHPRGVYGIDGYPVAQSGTSEFRVYIETNSPRTANE